MPRCGEFNGEIVFFGEDTEVGVEPKIGVVKPPKSYILIGFSMK